jgi:hypothetical protein
MNAYDKFSNSFAKNKKMIKVDKFLHIPQYKSLNVDLSIKDEKIKDLEEEIKELKEEIEMLKAINLEC